jgi:probable rRNA maturation factor
MDVQFANQQDLAPVDEPRLHTLCERLMAEHGADAGLSVVFVDNAAMRDLNARFRSEDAVTDVLAFPLDDASDPHDARQLGEEAVDEAARRDGSVASEIALYVAHGLLHLLGYDDHDPAETSRMREAEARALAGVGLDPAP